jgi:hypothetical protein
VVADTIGQASLAFSCASIAYATFSPIAGSVTDCVHQDRRKYMINIALYVCGISSNTIRDYQLKWPLATRKIIAYVFCFQEVCRHFSWKQHHCPASFER